MTTVLCSPFNRRATAGSLLTLALLVSGCSKTEVTSYRVAKEKDAELPGSMTAPANTSPTPPEKLTSTPSPAAAGADMAATPVPTASGPGLTWTAPAHWQAKPARPCARAPTPSAGDTTADLSITAFPGDVGGEVCQHQPLARPALVAAAPKPRFPPPTRFEQGGLEVRRRRSTTTASSASSAPSCRSRFHLVCETDGPRRPARPRSPRSSPSSKP
jgi:hypothetical protein